MRTKRVLAAFLICAGASLVLPASAAAGPLDGVGDAVDDVTGFVDPFGGGGPNVQDAIGGAAEGILDMIANAMLDGASWLLGGINSLIDSTTEVRITGISTACERETFGEHDVAYPASCYEPVDWFGEAYGAMWALAALFALGVVFIAAIDAVVRGQTHELIRLPLRVIVAFALTAAAIAVTGMLLQFTDEISNWIAGSGGRPATDFFAANQDAIEALKGEGDEATEEGEAGPAPVFVRMLVALAMALGAVVVWIELLLRASAIFVGVFFLPLAIVAMVWPRTTLIFKRIAEILLALIFCKFGVVAVVALGGRAVVAAEGDVGQALAGATILLLACLMPILLLHMVHFAEGAWAMAGTAGAGARAAVAAPAVVTRGATMMAIASRNWSGRAWTAARGRGTDLGAGRASETRALPVGLGPAAGTPENRSMAGSPDVARKPASTTGSDGGPTSTGATRPMTEAVAGQPHRGAKAADAEASRPPGAQAPAAPTVEERESGESPAPPPSPSHRRPVRDPFEEEG